MKTWTLKIKETEYGDYLAEFADGSPYVGVYNNDVVSCLRSLADVLETEIKHYGEMELIPSRKYSKHIFHHT